MSELIISTSIFWGFTVIGLPVSRQLLKSLPSAGYILSKVVGWLVYSYVLWIILHTGLIGANRSLFIIVFSVLFGAGITFLFVKKREIESLRQNLGLVITAEILFICAMWAYALFRSLSPEILGTEKPMEFAFLNSVMRSDMLPPIDPWLSGFQINYYYFGYVAVGALSLVAGIKPAIGFNIGLCSIFATAVLGCFALGYNIFGLTYCEAGNKSRNIVGLVAVVLTLISGNLAAVRLFGGIAEHLDPYFFNGLSWESSRVIETFGPSGKLRDYTINEFPFFSFALGDLHPHVLVLPNTLLSVSVAIGWLLSWSRSKIDYGYLFWLTAATSWVMGCIWGTNPWDVPAFAGATLLFGLIGVVLHGSVVRFSKFILHYIALIIGAVLWFMPFHLGFKSFFNGVGIVAQRTMIADLFEMHGLWIIAGITYVCFGLMPASRRLRPVILIIASTLLIWGLMPSLASITLISAVFVAIAWRIRLQLLTGTDPRWFVLPSTLIVGLGLMALPEIVFLDDFFGPPYERMNTVFKFHYQAWIILGPASAVVFYELYRRGFIQLTAMNKMAVFGVGSVVAGLLVVALVYPAVTIHGRLQTTKSLSLDGLAFAQSQSPEIYQAAIWLKDNSSYDTVILEAPGTSYSDFNMISGWTGIPTLIGWGQHERLWRNNLDVIESRKDDARAIYVDGRIDLLEMYGVKYVVVGPREREKYGSRIDDTFKSLSLVYQGLNNTNIYGVTQAYYP